MTTRWKQGAWVFVTALFLSLGWTGCGGRSVSGVNSSDGSVQGDAGGQRDGAVQDDGSAQGDGSLVDADQRPDAGQCENPGDTWSVEEVPIQELTVLTSDALGGPVPEGVSVRIQAVISVGGCDEPAGLSWTVDPEARRITVHASEWSYHGTRVCPEVEMLVPLFAVVAWQGRGGWTVEDANSYLAATFGMRRCPQGQDCTCQAWDGIPGDVGDDCAYDCQCSYPLTCVFDGQATFPPQGHCFETCSTDADCAPGLGLVCQLGVLSGPNGVCVNGDRSCSNDGDCRPGFSCMDSDRDPSLKVCQPSMLTDLTSDVCEDDCDCPAGYKCADMEETGRCVIPCAGQFDCPDALCCGQWLDYGLYSGPTCSECTDDSTAPAPIPSM